jgi:hypothetical protein
MRIRVILLESHGELRADLERLRGRARGERLRALAMVGLAVLRGGAPDTDISSEGEGDADAGQGDKRTKRRLKF